MTSPVAGEREDALLLLKARGFINRGEIRQTALLAIVGQEILDILLDLREVKNEKLMFGLKIAQLQQKIDARFDRAQLVEHLFFRGGELKVVCALVGGEARQPIERLNLLRAQDLQTPLCLQDLWTLHRASLCTPVQVSESRPSATCPLPCSIICFLRSFSDRLRSHETRGGDDGTGRLCAREFGWTTPRCPGGQAEAL